MQVDGCYADVSTYNVTYPELGRALNNTGRSIVYSCSWPAYLPDPVQTGIQVCKAPYLVLFMPPACQCAPTVLACMH